MSKILLLGATGYLGKQIKRKFFCKVYKGDLRNPINSKKSKYVIFCAFDKSNTPESVENNRKITNNVIEYCKKTGAKLIHFNALCFNKSKNYYIESKKEQLDLIKSSGINYHVLDVGSIIEDKRNVIYKIIHGECNRIYADTEIIFSSIKSIIKELKAIIK